MKNEIYELAEIQVSYRNKNDNPIKITSSQDAYKMFYSNSFLNESTNITRSSNSFIVNS